MGTVASRLPFSTAERPRKKLHGLLVTLCLLAGLTSIWGGLELVLRPDGSFVGLPLSLLQHTPFHDFLVPGLLLAVVVGGTGTVAGLLVLARSPIADEAAFFAGATLATWIVAEMILLRAVHWLHAVYLVLGAAMIVVALMRDPRAWRLRLV